MSKRIKHQYVAPAQRKRTTPWVLVSAIACMIAIVAMIVVLVIKLTPKKGEFSPPPFESAITVGTPEVPPNLGWGEAEAEEFSAKICGVVNIDEDKADLWVTNPEENTVWIKLRVLDENGKILAETGLIRPGEYLQTVHFDKVPKSGSNVTLKVMAYYPDTYVSAGSINLQTVTS